MTNRTRSRRHGATILLLTFLMLVLICMIVFAVEVGRMMLTKAQLQTAVDAGAIASALLVASDPDAADDAAEQFVQLNRAGWNVTVPSSAITVEIGNWDPVGQTFSSSPADPMATRVSASLTNEPFLFARIFRDSFDVSVDAIAVAHIKPQDIMMVLDLSGSMSDDGRIEALQAAAPVFVDTVEENAEEQLIAVIGYGVRPSTFSSPSHGTGTPYTFAPAALYPEESSWVGVLEASLTDDFNFLRDTTLSSSSLVAAKYGGGTPIGAAVRDGTHCLIYGAGARSNVNKVMVLMSDGHANKPEDDADNYALSMAAYAQSNDVVIHTISLGNSADTVLMDAIASATGGTHFLATGSGAGVLTAELTEAFREAALAISTAVLVE